MKKLLLIAGPCVPMSFGLAAQRAIDQDKAYDYFSAAWPRVLANLQKRFAEGPVDRAPWLEQMKKASGR